MKPLLYFSYAMTKTGSTLAYHLADVALGQAGCLQPKIPAPMVGLTRKINFVTHLGTTDINALWGIAKNQGYPLLVKTHTRPDPAVINAINSGIARASTCTRDPRDMALSMLDHGEKARLNDVKPFAEIATLDDAIKSIAEQQANLAEWQSLPNTLRLNYEDIAFNTAHTIKNILKHLDIEGNLEAIEKMAKSRFTQHNKGVSNRHKTEMNATDSAHVLAALDNLAYNKNP